MESEDSTDGLVRTTGRDGWDQNTGVEGVTAADIKLFRTSIMTRRFPGLKILSDEDVAALIVADRKATGRKLEPPQKGYPKTKFVVGHQKTRNDPVWIPNNPGEAREAILMQPQQAFAGMFSPYDADKKDFLDMKHSDAKKVAGPDFKPSNPSEARTMTEVNYFLYSATARSKQADRDSLRDRTALNKSAYGTVYTQRRGNCLT